MKEQKIILEMRGIDKRFGSTYALKQVDFSLQQGEVLGLIGENGAGKSTLIKILGGIYTKDAGEVFVNGERVQINNVLDAQNLGIRIIHQELVLVQSISIAENIFIGRLPIKNGFVDFNAIYKRTQELLDEFGLKYSPKTLVSELSIADQQMVEIIKAIAFDAKIVVMDEPTSSLADKECAVLFETIRMLRDRGVSIIYISHRMSELDVVADRVIVLRDGQNVGVRSMETTTLDELINLMVGREIGNFYVRDGKPAEKVALEVKNLTTSKVRNISFQLHEGEILGFSGLVGAGRTELMRALYGIDKVYQGEVFLEGKKVSIVKPKDALKYGIGFVPEDRRGCGFIPRETIKFNIVIKVLSKFIKGIHVDYAKEHEIAAEQYERFSIRAAGLGTMVVELSGGNQQKVVLSHCMAANPRVMIFDEPTRGVDVGAKSEIYHIMNELSKQGVSIILVSSDLPEVLNMSDRIAVMAEGQITAILDREEASQEKIMKHAVLI